MALVARQTVVVRDPELWIASRTLDGRTFASLPGLGNLDRRTHVALVRVRCTVAIASAPIHFERLTLTVRVPRYIQRGSMRRITGQRHDGSEHAAEHLSAQAVRPANLSGSCGGEAHAPAASRQGTIRPRSRASERARGTRGELMACKEV